MFDKYACLISMRMCLISMRSYLKIVAADTSYSLTRASLDRRKTLGGREAASSFDFDLL